MFEILISCNSSIDEIEKPGMVEEEHIQRNLTTSLEKWTVEIHNLEGNEGVSLLKNVVGTHQHLI